MANGSVVKEDSQSLSNGHYNPNFILDEDDSKHDDNRSSTDSQGRRSENWSDKDAKISITRPTIDWQDLQFRYGKQTTRRKSLYNDTKSSVQSCCNNCSLFTWLISLFPFLSWIRSYSIKHNLLSDVIAGFTIAVLHIPQGMAYGLLAGVNPINGLYVSFFPVLVYAFMGTSRHISIGTCK